MSQISTLVPQTLLPGDLPPVAKPTPTGDALRSRFMLDRMTFGFTQGELAIYQALGFEGYLDWQLNPTSIDDSSLDAYLATNYATLVMTPLQIIQYPQQGDIPNQLIRARLMRAIFSRRQLFERVVEMWTDHFNIWIGEDLAGVLKTIDDRDVIRPNALGTFPALLSASARSPSMLAYLNNDTNIFTAPNENYARELMELHSLSVSGGYSQSDVQQVARCFTGWNYVRGTGATAYTFTFNTSQHDTGQKVVLGQVIPPRTGASGLQDGVDVLNILANHPSTRQFIALKIARAFHSYNPPQSLINSLATIYQSTGGNIAAMVRATLKYTFDNPMSLKYKRPMHLLASTLRALSAQVTAPNNVQTPLIAAGNGPFNWISPDGYPDTLEAWTGLLLARWNFGALLMSTSNFNSTTNTYNGSWANSSGVGVRVDHTLVVGTATTAAAVTAALNTAVFNGTLPLSERNQLINYVPGSNTSPIPIRDRIGLAVSLPSFQWY